ncbi:c-type cytochrome [Verrucomicrobium sp. 3C]|uniref:c-type cytochrome n=1 Tax=Verrucomicrobium sp. 3C TaxID=1134055 RepID=UPI0003746556|nr:c-type cytochrome [Verrucomicrobium sp. 3C]
MNAGIILAMFGITLCIQAWLLGRPSDFRKDVLSKLHSVQVRPYTYLKVAGGLVLSITVISESLTAIDLGVPSPSFDSFRYFVLAGLIFFRVGVPAGVTFSYLVSQLKHRIHEPIWREHRVIRGVLRAIVTNLIFAASIPTFMVAVSILAIMISGKSYPPPEELLKRVAVFTVLFIILGICFGTALLFALVADKVPEWLRWSFVIALPILLILPMMTSLLMIPQQFGGFRGRLVKLYIDSFPGEGIVKAFQDYSVSAKAKYNLVSGEKKGLEGVCLVDETGDTLYLMPFDPERGMTPDGAIFGRGVIGVPRISVRGIIYGKDVCPSLGEVLYGHNCASCHGEAGKGIPGAVPGLVGSELAAGGSERAVVIVLNGHKGPVKEHSCPRRIAVDGWEEASTRAVADNRVAALLTYIRQSWGNDGKPVTFHDVTTARTHEESQGR